jgi:hypothetical protein
VPEDSNAGSDSGMGGEISKRVAVARAAVAGEVNEMRKAECRIKGKVVKRIDTKCYFCGVAVRAFEDDPKPLCAECDSTWSEFVSESLERESQLANEGAQS